jgi:AraC family transcriptional regulator, transcriptional activator of pobA
MTTTSTHTLINPQTKALAFKIFSFEDNSHFDHLQRLGYYSILLVRRGSGVLKADFSDYSFTATCLLCFSPYQPFMLEEKETLNGVALHFHPDFFCIHKHQKEVACNGILFNNIYQPPLVMLTDEVSANLLELMEKMKTEVGASGLAQYELLVSYLKIFLITASRIKAQQRPATDVITAQNEPFILQKLKDAIEENYRSKHSPTDYATMLHISPKALAKATKTYFNKTLTNLISERIVIEAKRELYLTSKAVKEIAYELGFEDEYYFSRFFKINADVSPQGYRETVGFARSES